MIGGTTLLLTVAVALVLAMAPAAEQDRVQELAERLRCPVCTSVSVAESPSDTAVAMRQVIEDQVAAGRSDDEIEAYFRARYGDWAVIDPPESGSTLLLWLLPVAATVAGAALLLSRRFRRACLDAPEPSEADQARVDQALDRSRESQAQRGLEP
ncbi:cytochrome C biosynthesis protein (plasmid) [Pseudonocardia sp. EC080625-04]|uniref:cytochrome c-type biogenesis protein n=1 Tax=unclassified Pseudonocardia TaxID=2619320 RepID=UPI0006CAFCE4|nr:MULTISPECIES: cytochrome c-type biogenesis protein [unclassified Pseudonocardia]ALE76958.1 cytochrome C biosynthesis protein [Pseudonocardia sp. EC080625-04]